MMRRISMLLALLFATVTPVVSSATANPRLVSVVPTDGGCVAGPVGSGVQAWDVEAGKTYLVTIDNVVDCANGGTDPSMTVRVNSEAVGNTNLVANNVGLGAYSFTYTLPNESCGTFPIFACVTGGANTGILVRRNDGGPFQAHLRTATFGNACSSSTPVECLPTPTRNKTWGQIKSIYR